MVNKKKSRKTGNELELLKVIIQENNILYNRVMHRLRDQLALSRQTIFDVVKQKQDAQKNKS